jgi:hypothetical protein
VQRIPERDGDSRLAATRRLLDCCVNLTNPPVEIGEEFASDKQPPRFPQPDAPPLPRLQAGARDVRGSRTQTRPRHSRHEHGDHRRQARPQGPRRGTPILPQPCGGEPRAIPIAITGQNAPPKMAVNPSMEKAAETLVSASAADSVANITGVLRCSTAETGAAGVTGATGSVTAAVTGSVTASVTSPVTSRSASP